MIASIVYEEMLKGAVEPFLRQPVSSYTIHYLTQVVVHTRQSFLNSYPDYVALGEVIVRNEGNSNYNISAPICTYQEKQRLDYEAKQRENLIEEFKEQSRKREGEEHRREASMLRNHRKLMRKYSHKIPPSTSNIWNTLEVGQQYAILKDIDYNERHKQ